MRGRDLAGDAELSADLTAAGYIGMEWPPEHGGRQAKVEELMALHEKLRYRGSEPRVLSTAALIATRSSATEPASRRSGCCR